jgi:hypothetical protein
MIVRDGVRRTVVHSADGRHQLQFGRFWGAGDPAVLWVLAMPTEYADGNRCDPVIAQMVGFSAQEGFDGMHVATLCTLRNEAERAAASLLVDPTQLQHLAVMAAQCEAIVCAWGSPYRETTTADIGVRWAIDARGPETLDVLDRLFPHLPRYCLGRTPQGFPRTPNYTPHTARFQPFAKGALYDPTH